MDQTCISDKLLHLVVFHIAPSLLYFLYITHIYLSITPIAVALILFVLEEITVLHQKCAYLPYPLLT